MIDQAFRNKLEKQISDLETRMSDPVISADHKKYTEIVREHSLQKRVLAVVSRVLDLQQGKVEAEEMLQEKDPEIREMAQEELDRILEEMPLAERDLKIALLPVDENEGRSIIVEIRAGTGGDEAGLFAGDLFRMYQRYAESQNWKVEVIEASQSEKGGYKEVIFSIDGELAWRQLQFESGVHRVQRVPVTEASGRIHTSAATVAVLTEAEDVDIDIQANEIKIDFFRSSGPGGQSVNTTDSAVRITHIETGVIATCQDEKSQHKNKDKAMRVLRSRLLDLYQRLEHEKQSSERRSQIGSGDRSERIRTYNFPQNRLSDHRINLTLYSLDKIVEGEISEMTSALYEHHIEMLMKAQMEKNTTSGDETSDDDAS